MPIVTDPNGFSYYEDENGNTILPISNEPSPNQPEPSQSQSQSSQTPITSSSGNPVTVGYTYDEWGNPIPITYTPPPVAAQQPTNTTVYTETPGTGKAVPVSSYTPWTQPGYVPTPQTSQANIQQVKSQTDAFNQKWEPKIDPLTNRFIGTSQELQQYKLEAQALNYSIRKLNEQNSLLVTQSKDATQAFEDRLKSSNPELYNLYKEQGLDAYNAKVTELNSSNAQQIKIQQEAISKLGDYHSIDEAGADKYNITRYLKDNSNSDDALSTLKDAGFSQEDIDTAKNSVDIILRTVDYLNTEMSIESAKSGKINADDEIALGRAMRVAGLNFPSGVVHTEWRNLSEEEKLKVAEIFAKDDNKSNAFSNTIADLAQVGSMNLAANLLVSPIVALGTPLQKALIHEAITPSDIANAGITAALIAVPVISGLGSTGSVVAKGILAGSAGYFTAQTVQDWDTMSTPQKAISLTFDALLIWGALPSAAKTTIINGVKQLATEERGSIGSPRQVVEAVKSEVTLDDAQTLDLESALQRVQDAISEGSAYRLFDAAKALKYVGKEIGSDLIARYADDLQYRPNDYIRELAQSVKDIPQSELTQQMQKISDVTNTNRQLPTKLISPSDVGLTEQQFSEFLKQRVVNPDLSVSQYLASKDIAINKPNIDWTQITDALKRGESTTQIAKRTVREYSIDATNTQNLLKMLESEKKSLAAQQAAKVIASQKEQELVAKLNEIRNDAGRQEFLKEANNLTKLNQNIKAELQAIREGKAIAKTSDISATYTDSLEILAKELDISVYALGKLKGDLSSAIAEALLLHPDTFEELLNSLDTETRTALLNQLSPELRHALETGTATDIASQLAEELQTALASETTVEQSLEAELKEKTVLLEQTETQLQNAHDTESTVTLETSIEEIQKKKEELEETLKQLNGIETNTETEVETPKETEIIDEIETVEPKDDFPKNEEEEIETFEFSKKNRDKFPYKVTLDADNKDNKAIALEHPSIYWKQGWAYWVIHYPYKSKSDIECLRQAPDNAKQVSGKGSAYRTIQGLGGNPDIFLTVDLGAFDVTIENPQKKAGRAGSIRFNKDKYQQTSSDLSVRGVRMS